MTAHVVLYHTASCPYCVRAERLLEAKGVTDIERIRVDLDPEQRADHDAKDRPPHRAADLRGRHPRRRFRRLVCARSGRHAWIPC